MPAPGGIRRRLSNACAAPAQECIALAIALDLEPHIALQRVGAAGVIHHHRVVDDEIHRHGRIDAPRVAAQPHHGVAHRRHVAHERNARRIDHQHARRLETDFALGAALFQPRGNRFDVLRGGGAFGMLTQQIFQHDLERIRQPRNAGEPHLFGRGETVIVIPLAVYVELAQSARAVDLIWHGR